MTTDLTAYDIEVGASDSVGFMFAKDSRKTVGRRPREAFGPQPEVPLGTSSAPSQSGGLYDVRILKDARRLTYSDWDGGAGQDTYDLEESSSSRFLRSRRVECRDGKLRLAGRRMLGAQAQLDKTLCLVDGYVFAGFTPDAVEDTDGDTGFGQIRYWAGGDSWTRCVLEGTVPGVDQYVRAMCWDGSRNYVAFSSGSPGNGSLWRSKINTTPFNPVTDRYELAGAIGNIAAMVNVGGVLYAARDRYEAGSAATGFGVIATPSGTPSYTEKMPAAVVSYRLRTAGLAENANRCYWAATDGQSSWVYSHAGSEAAASLTHHFADGFIATTIFGYLGILYVGGYTFAEGAGRTGILYAITGNEATRVATFKNDDAETADHRPLAITGHDDRLYVLTGEDLWVRDVRSGGYWQLVNVPASNTLLPPAVQPPPPNAPTPNDSPPIGWDYEWPGSPRLDSWDPKWTRTAVGDLSKLDKDLISGSGHLIRILSTATNTRVQYTMIPGEWGVVFDPAASGYKSTMELAFVRGSATEDVRLWMLIADGQHTVRARVYGSEGYWMFCLSGWDGSHETWQATAWATEDQLEHVLRLTLNNGVARLYVDGAFALQSTNLRVSGEVYAEWAVGNLGLQGKTNVWIDYVNVSDHAAVPPGYSQDPSYPPPDPLPAPPSPTAVNIASLLVDMSGFVHAPVAGICHFIYDPSGCAESGYLRSSRTHMRMSGVQKHFWRLDVSHSQLRPGESLWAKFLIDGRLAWSNAIVAHDPDLEVQPTLTKAYIDVYGSEVEVEWWLYSALGTSIELLGANVVYAIPGMLQHAYVLNLHANANTGEGNFALEWDYDPGIARARLESLYTRGTIEVWKTRKRAFWGKLDEYQFYADDANAEEGTAVVKVTDLGDV